MFTMSTIEGTLHIRWENDGQPVATPRYKLMFSRYKDFKGGAQPSKLLVGSDALETYLIEVGFRPEDAKDWIKQLYQRASVSIPNVMMLEEQMSVYER